MRDFAKTATEKGRRLIRSSNLDSSSRHGEDDPDDETDDRNDPRIDELVTEGDGNADHHDQDGGSKPAGGIRSHDNLGLGQTLIGVRRSDQATVRSADLANPGYSAWRGS